MAVNAQYPSQFPARIAFVGEAPGASEVDKGIPLIGASGNVFNAMLRTANLDRSEFHITNVFNEKIPDNDIKNWCSNEKNDLPPIGAAGYLKPDYHYHLARLRDELADVNPSIVVPLG